jgi:hypothetical protein
MKTRLFYLLLLMLVISAMTIGCARKAASVQPGYKPPVLKPYYATGILTLNPLEQSGKILPIQYSSTTDGESIICQVTIEQIIPGDSGSITWMLTNSGYQDAQLLLAADIVANSSVTADSRTLDYIGIKLKYDNIYCLGDSSTFVPLTILAPYLKDQFRILAEGEVTLYKLEWQIATNPAQAGPDSIFGTADDISLNGDMIKNDQTTIHIDFSLFMPDSAQ